MYRRGKRSLSSNWMPEAVYDTWECVRGQQLVQCTHKNHSPQQQSRATKWLSRFATGQLSQKQKVYAAGHRAAAGIHIYTCTYIPSAAFNRSCVNSYQRWLYSTITHYQTCPCSGPTTLPPTGHTHMPEEACHPNHSKHSCNWSEHVGISLTSIRTHHDKERMAHQPLVTCTACSQVG